MESRFRISTDNTSTEPEPRADFSSQRQTRGASTPEDSISVLSMASSRSKGLPICYVCKDPEALPTKRLLRCERCKARYHKCCHNPQILDESIPFICSHCVKKQDERRSSSYTAPFVTLIPQAKFKDIITPKQYESSKGGSPCSVIGCKNLAQSFNSRTNNSMQVCKQHEIQNKFDNALAQPKPIRSQQPPRPPIQKNKLYPTRPYDRAVLKRKRSLTQKATSYDGSGPRSNNVEEDRHAAKDVDLPPAYRCPSRPINPAISGQSASNVDGHTERDRNGSLGSVNLITSIITERPLRLGSSSGSEPINKGPGTGVPPGYEPTPPTYGFGASWSRTEEEDETPGSQIQLELQSVARQNNQSEPRAQDRGIITNSTKSNPRTFPRNGGFNQFPDLPGLDPNQVSATGISMEHHTRSETDRESSPQLPFNNIDNATGDLGQRRDHIDSSRHKKSSIRMLLNSDPVGNYWEVVNTTARHSLTGGVPDQRMIPPQPPQFTNEGLNEDAAASDHPPRVSPDDSSSSAHTDDVTDNNEFNLGNEPSYKPTVESDLGSALSDLVLSFSKSTPSPTSIEAHRARKATDYDPSSLDAYLKMQSQPKSTDVPTQEELLETQIWGHVDPRKVWQAELPASWLEEKRKEIAARGGKKANFGKLITAQNRKERLEKGWNIHQVREAKPLDEDDLDRITKLEELVGIKDIRELVPAVRNGVLCMVDPPEADDEEGHQPGLRKKKTSRCFPV